MIANIFSRAIHGVLVPHYFKGELVGEHRKYNDRLAMFLLRHNDLGRYAKGYDGINPREFTAGARAPARADHLFDRMDILEHGPRPKPEDADDEEGFYYDMD